MRARGFTLVEVMVAALVASLLVTFVLSLARTQIGAFEQNSQVSGAQQNGRAGIEFLEPVLRDTCAGISSGLIEVNLASRGGASATDFQTACLRVWNGANITSGVANATASGGSFSPGASASRPDAIELVYANGRAYTRAVGSAATGTNPVITVPDTTGFQTGDYVLLTNDYVTAVLTGPVTVNATAGTITVSGLSVALDKASRAASLIDTTLGTSVFSARSIAFYVDQSNAQNPVLMYDPDGLAGPTHSDAVPLVEGVEDFQIAVANDGRTCPGCVSCDGIAQGTGATAPNDEWIGNDPSADEFPLPTPSTAAPWVPVTCTAGAARLLSIRASLLVRTLNSYAGASTNVSVIEDRTSYSATLSGGPRRRVFQLEVAPREWSLTE